jgi:hypothetical protein
MIREQMIAIKQGQEIIMKQYDYEVLNDLINVSIHETVTICLVDCSCVRFS